MLILSQDKNKIINLNNMNTIFANNKGSILSFDNTWKAGDDCSDLLGEYDTEERAKEVLQEIIERYTNWNNLVYGQPTGFCSPKYEMPEK